MTEQRSRTETAVTRASDRIGTSEKHAAGLRHQPAAAPGLTGRLATRPQTPEQAEERYVAARDAWATALRAASSGRPADLAALAIAQDAYESALAERERWGAMPKAAVPIQPDRATGIEAIVRQEMIRRDVHEHEAHPQPTGLRRLFRRKPRG